MPKNCSGYCTIGLLGVQLELGAAASPFEDRDLPAGNAEQLFGIGALQRAGIGAHRGVYPDLPRQHLLPPGGIPCPAAPGMITRTIVRLPDRARPGVPPGVPPG